MIKTLRDWFEEGDVCPHCEGKMGYAEVEGCSCENWDDPPCPICENNPLVCLKCGWEEDV